MICILYLMSATTYLIVSHLFIIVTFDVASIRMPFSWYRISDLRQKLAQMRCRIV